MAATPHLVTLLRHGEVAWRPHTFLGTSDPPLTDRGRAAMRATIAAIDRPTITGVVTSPLARCREFAESFAAERSLPLSVVPAFSEMRFGAWEGLTVEEVRARDRPLLEAFQADPSRATPPGAERFAEFLERVSGALERLTKTSANHTLVVTHAGVIRAALASALGLAAYAFPRIALPVLATCRLSLLEGEPPCLLALNFVPADL